LLSLKSLYITLFYSGRDTQAVGQIGNIPGISRRLSASQLMVKVGYMWLYVKCVLELG
jgi:hypothetical protein